MGCDERDVARNGWPRPGRDNGLLLLLKATARRLPIGEGSNDDAVGRVAVM